MSKTTPANFGIIPTIRITRDKYDRRLWEAIWYIGDRPMSSTILPDDRAYIEANYDVQVDTMSVAETYEYLIIKEKTPAPAPEKEITP